MISSNRREENQFLYKDRCRLNMVFEIWHPYAKNPLIMCEVPSDLLGLCARGYK